MIWAMFKLRIVPWEIPSGSRPPGNLIRPLNGGFRKRSLSKYFYPPFIHPRALPLYEINLIHIHWFNRQDTKLTREARLEEHSNNHRE